MKMVAAAKYARAEKQLKPARIYGNGALGTSLQAASAPLTFNPVANVLLMLSSVVREGRYQGSGGQAWEASDHRRDL